MTQRSFLFWNIGKLTRRESLIELTSEINADVVMLAECHFDVADLCKELGNVATKRFRTIRTNDSRVKTLTSIRSLDFEPICVDVNQRYVIFNVSVGVRNILLAAAHLRSKMHGNEDGDQSLQVTHFVDEIRRIEGQRRHERTIVVGDLNMNPFEYGVMAARCLHGVPTKTIAMKKSRIVEQRDYPFFYNPMWSFFGDESSGPAGTFYDSRANHGVCFWNMFDQVLVRPDLISKFSGMTIHDRVGTVEFIRKSGILNTGDGSDHLPISFSVEF